VPIYVVCLAGVTRRAKDRLFIGDLLTAVEAAKLCFIFR